MESLHGRIPPGAHAVGDRSPICAAPLVAMEFDPFGDVQACCANGLYPLGNVAQSSLMEIWRGERASALRSAVAAGDLSLGCTVCRYRMTYGHGELPLEYYDNFPLRDGDPGWPSSLQFSLHNTCNLECVMCGADRSSRIRSRRSGLDPLPHVYGDQFFAELEPFLANCAAVDLSGGEPFLIPEHQRVWDLLIEMDHRPLCSLTTNGTIWNDRVERVLDHLDTHVSVSVDGMTAETFESIRVGADFDVVMDHLDRFLAYTRERGTILTMSWSLVRSNWHELAAAMRFAEERGIQVKVQTVIEPEYGLQRLPTEELAVIVDNLEHEGVVLEPELELNLDMWRREVRRLREELDHRVDGTRRALCMEPPGPGNVAHVVASVLDGSARTLDSDTSRDARACAVADLRRWCPGSEIAEVRLDTDGRVCHHDLDHLIRSGSWPPAAPPEDLTELLGQLEAVFDGRLWVGEEFDEGDRMVHTLWVGREVRDKVGLILRMVSFAGTDGTIVLLASDDRLLRGASTVPVALRARRPARSAG